MENFFDIMFKPVPKEEVIVWFNIHNMNYEKIELYGDFFKSLYETVNDTYLGNDVGDTKILMTEQQKKGHFEWCWDTTLKNFSKENILIKPDGEHKKYFKNFFIETFYEPIENRVKIAIPNFLEEVFNLDKPFTKTDLEILKELYILMEKNLE